MKKIPLSQGLFALVDDEDYERVSQYKWCASKESRGTKFYAIRWERINGKQTKIRMHRFILGLPPGKQCSHYQNGLVVDHVNGNSLDNRKCNLELVDWCDNMYRSDGFRKQMHNEKDEVTCDTGYPAEWDE